MRWPRFLDRPALSPGQRAALQALDPRSATDLAVRLGDARFVVVDVETSGLDPRADRLLAIGAVAVERGLVALADTFHVTLRQEEPSSAENILVHGICGTSQTGGTDPVDALLAWLAFAGAAPLVAFHAAFDRAIIEREMKARLGTSMRNVWLDVADLAPALMPEHRALRTLDDWLGALGIENYRRHDALADALATAQLLQVVLTRAGAGAHASVADLVDTAKAHRWLRRS